MSYTKGPLIIVDHGAPNNIDIVAGERLIAEVACPPMLPEYGVPDDSRPECEANARLFAAAPELLEACEAVEWISLSAYPDEFCPRCRRFKSEEHHPNCPLKAAIAKARGE